MYKLIASTPCMNTIYCDVSNISNSYTKTNTVAARSLQNTAKVWKPYKKFWLFDSLFIAHIVIICVAGANHCICCLSTWFMIVLQLVAYVSVLSILLCGYTTSAVTDEEFKQLQDLVTVSWNFMLYLLFSRLIYCNIPIKKRNKNKVFSKACHYHRTQ